MRGAHLAAPHAVLTFDPPLLPSVFTAHRIISIFDDEPGDSELEEGEESDDYETASEDEEEGAEEEGYSDWAARGPRRGRGPLRGWEMESESVSEEDSEGSASSSVGRTDAFTLKRR